MPAASRASRLENRHRWAGTKAAVFSTTVVLLASVWFGWRYAKTLGPVESGVQHFPDLSLGVIVIIYIGTTLAVMIIAAWAVLFWRPRLVLFRKQI